MRVSYNGYYLGLPSQRYGFDSRYSLQNTFNKNIFMEINLTWDLFIIVFFMLIVAYSFIIWWWKTLKILLWSYFAIFTADWLWNLLIKISEDIAPILKLPTLSNNDFVLIIAKILLFIFWIVFLWTKWNFEVSIPEWFSSAKKALVTLMFATLSAALFITTIIIFSSWWSFLSFTWMTKLWWNLSVYKDSYLVQLIVLNYNIVFSAPAIIFWILSLKWIVKEEPWWEDEEWEEE